MGKKNKLGLSLRRKKGIFGPRIGKKLSIRTKFDQFFPKKRFFGPKIVEKMEFKCQKLTNFPTKVEFWAKNWEKIEYKSQKLSSQFLCQPVGSGFWKQDSQNTTFPQHERSEAERMRGP